MKESGRREKRLKNKKVVVLCCVVGSNVREQGFSETAGEEGSKKPPIVPPREIIGGMGTRSKKRSDEDIAGGCPEEDVRTFDEKRTAFFSVVFFRCEGRRGQIEVSFSLSFSLSFF